MIEITAIIKDAICNDDDPRSMTFQEATYTLDGVTGPGVLCRYIDASGDDVWDDGLWSIYQDACAIRDGIAPGGSFFFPLTNDPLVASERPGVTLLQDVKNYVHDIQDAWARWDAQQ